MTVRVPSYEMMIYPKYNIAVLNLELSYGNHFQCKIIQNRPITANLDRKQIIILIVKTLHFDLLFGVKKAFPVSIITIQLIFKSIFEIENID